MRREKLSSLCKISNGYAFKSDDYVNVGHRVMRITNVQKGFVVDDDPKFVPNEIATKANNFKLKAGDILVSLTGNVGRVGRVLQQHLPAVLNQRVGLIRPTSSEIDESYLFQILNSDRFEREAIQNSNGVAQLNLSSKWIESYEIPLPSLNDQIRIAHLLGKVEELITQRKQHLQQLDDLLKSVFLEMFSPSSDGYEDWPLVAIQDLAEKHKGAMRTGPFGSNLLHSEFTENGDVAVLGIDNAVQNRFAWGERRYITNEKYEELKNYRIFPGDVIVTIMGTIGRSAVIPDDIPLAINTKHLAAITLDKNIANPLFVSYSIHSSPYILNQFKSKNRGAIMSGLNLGLIKETKLKRPSIEMQNQFAAIHKKVDEVKSNYQQSLNDLESLYGALSQQAFKGELDLSRVPLLDIQANTEELAPFEQAETPEAEGVAINLLDTDYLLDALTDVSLRERLLHDWLESYCQQIGNTAFSTDTFLAAAQTRIAELHPDTDFELGASDYEIVKNWVFDALEAGKLTQSLDDENNRIRLVKGKPA